MHVLVTILARANSKGLPGKCTKMFHGKPLYLHSVDQAKAWGKGDIVISTNIKEILENLPPGVNGRERPSFLCEDSTPKIMAITDAFFESQIKNNCLYDSVIDLDITNPLRTPYDIENAFKLFCFRNCPVLFSVTNAKKNPYFNQVRIDQGKIKTVAGALQFFTRQSAPIVFDLNSSIYIYKWDWLIHRESNSPIVENAVLYLMEKWQATDIDDKEDWEIAEMKYFKNWGLINGVETTGN